MFKLKLWLVPMLILIPGSLLLVSGTTYLHERLLPPYERETQHAKIAIKGQVQIDATQAVNFAADLTGRPAVRAAVLKGEAEAATAVLLEVPKGSPKPAFAVLATADGAVATQAGESPLGESVAGLPEFTEALTGVVRDGYGVYGDKSFHLAAAPVVDKAKAVGGVIEHLSLKEEILKLKEELS